MYLFCPATTSFPAICGANYPTFCIFCTNNKVVVVVDTERPELNLPPPERQYSSTPLESRVESNNSCATSALGDVACSGSQETPTEV